MRFANLPIRNFVIGILALSASGCQSDEVDKIGNISIGDSLPAASAPEMPGFVLVGWLCNDQTILPSGNSVPEQCAGTDQYTVMYRDASWQYGVGVEGGSVVRISKHNLDSYP